MSRTIEVSDKTYAKIKGQLIETDYDISEIGNMIGKKYFFRTVTYHCTGRVRGFFGEFAVLDNAAWIADSGRFSDAIKTGELNEVEPVGVMYLNLKAIIDFFPWKHRLPETQK